MTATVRESYPERESGEPVVLLHSTGSGSALWRRVAATLGERYRVFTPAFLGYGNSPPAPVPAEFSLERDAEQVGPLLEEIGSPVHLVGHSYGGRIALLYALEHPERLASLTLIEPIVVGVLRSQNELQPMAETEGARQALRPGADPAALAAGVEEFVNYWNGPGAWNALSPRARAGLRALAPKMAMEVTALAADPVPLSRYSEIQVPTLVISGSETTLAGARMSTLIARGIPGSVHVRIQGAGHMSPLTHPAEVGEVLTEHLQRHPARGSARETRSTSVAG